MRSIMRKCEVCGRYTMKDICSCGNKTSVVHPARFSPQDRFGGYRRRLKTIKRRESEHSE